MVNYSDEVKKLVRCSVLEAAQRDKMAEYHAAIIKSDKDSESTRRLAVELDELDAVRREALRRLA